jgi:hypothetical protein
MKLAKLLLAFCVLLCNNITAQNWNQTMKHIASIRSNTGNFGFAIAIDGNYAVVSSISESTDAFGSNLINKAGAAYVLQLINGNWVEIKKIVAPDRAADDNFGNSVSISGNTIVIAASSEDHNETGGNQLNNAGSIYIFNKDEGGVNNWGFVKKIVAPDRTAEDFFGQSVSISGNDIVVGASSEDEDAAGLNFINFAGSAYIFSKDMGGINNWGFVKKIVASDRAAVDQFGYAVCISGDVIAISAYQEDHDANGLNLLSNAGSVYVFYKNQGGANNWGQLKKIVALDRNAGDFFGNAIALNGNNLVVGAFQEDHDVTGAALQSNAGSAYVFNKDQGGSNNWGQVKKLVASDRITNDFFGRSVAINNNTIIVGAIAEDEDTNGNNTISNTGGAYIYTKDEGGLNNWGQLRKVTASDRGENDFFGISVAVNNDNILVGSFQEDENLQMTNTITDAGAIYAYKSGCNNTILATPFATVISNQESTPTTYYDGNCGLVAKITQQGATPIYAHTQAKVWVDGVQNSKYVTRHFEIKTYANAAIAIGKVTLYCTQTELNSFNAVSVFDLPTSSTDLSGINNIRVRKFLGETSTGTGSQVSYSGNGLVIDPVNSDIIWNAINNYWEISFVDTAFGGYFIEAPPPSITTTNPITSFTSCAGTPSANQALIVNATYLIDPLTITVPTGFQVSTLPNVGFNNSVIITPTGGVINTTVYVRLNSATSATPSGNIALTSTGATTIIIAVSGVANPPSIITTEPKNSNVCFGNNGSFSVTATGVNLTYQWQLFNGSSFVNIAGATNTLYPIPLPPSNGNFNGSQYRCIVGSVCAPDTSAVVTLNVSPTPSITLTATKTTLKPNETTTLTAVASTIGGVYTWFKNDATVPLSTSNTYGPLGINQLGSYKVTYTSPQGCSATSFPIVISGSISNQLYVYPNPSKGVFSYRYFNYDTERARVIVYNSNGKKVVDAGFISGLTYSQQNINISNQPAGYYIIAVTNKYNEILYQTPIIVSR